MTTMASQMTSPTVVYSTIYSDADQRKHQSSASLAFVRGIHRGPVNSQHKWPVTRKMFPFYEVIMISCGIIRGWWVNDHHLAEMWTCDVFFVSKLPSCQWFQTLLGFCNLTVMYRNMVCSEKMLPLKFQTQNVLDVLIKCCPNIFAEHTVCCNRVW